MTSGRRKTPSRLRLVSYKGNEPQPAELAALPPCPSYLTGYAAEEWARAGRELIAVRILTSLDLPLLAVWCDTFKRWRNAVEALDTAAMADAETRGAVVKSSTGSPYQNPLLGVANSAAREMRRLAQELGLSPSGRAGIPLSEPAARESALAKKYVI